MMIRRLLRNLHWKIFSLVAAAGLWLAFVRSPILVTAVMAPVEYMNVPQDLEIVQDVPDQRVRLDVRGPSAKLRSFEGAGTAVVLDLAGVDRPSERTFTITGRQVNLPSGLTLERAVPAQIRLRFERRVARSVPVRIVVASPPPPGYRVSRQEVRPGAVTIVGPEPEVREVDFVETDPIDLSQVVSSREFHTNVFTRNPHVRLASPGTVSVRVALDRNDDRTGD